ncbi:ABC transporter permease [Amycolatopsis sp. H20-H5]|uniref:ABC transporter permease n=1 Tax=Amycolatopsis sp. H20-H5 TaxID=3046309 RepID=UPI002DB9D27E|nr:ABC transporter permease [Amycolatopsis sp. H20-H5]MEC3982238.1 ABC transporter permease [Amycolatopsis sp. H20-H5]
MTTLVKVTRYHLLDRLQYVVLPGGITLFSFLVNLTVFKMFPPPDGDSYSGGLVTLYIWLFIPATLTVTKSLPFGFALGLSRRVYYLGTLLLMVGLSTAYALIITALQAIERATGGWGTSLHFFRIPWIFDGAPFQTWLTSFVVLALGFVYGLWFGLVHRRWQVVGLLLFIAAQVVVLLGAAMIVTGAGLWGKVGEFASTLNVYDLTAVLAAVTVVLAVGGFATMRRVTV